MNRNAWLSYALIAAVVLGTGPALSAQTSDRCPDPEAIARACVESAVRVANGCIAANAQTVERASGKITRLVEAGKLRAACALAKASVGVIRHRSDGCVRHVRRRCANCVGILIRLEEPQLAARVGSVCEEQVERIRASQARAVAAIRDALDGNEDGAEE
jgi:hypothetical protein